MRENKNFKVTYTCTTETAMSISGMWLLYLVGLVRSLLFLNTRGFFSASLCEDFSDLTSQTSYFCCKMTLFKKIVYPFQNFFNFFLKNL